MNQLLITKFQAFQLLKVIVRVANDFAHTFSGIWAPIFSEFLRPLNYKSAAILSAKCTFTHIMKILGKILKNVEEEAI